jgi:hypothetical protein
MNVRRPSSRLLLTLGGLTCFALGLFADEFLKSSLGEVTEVEGRELSHFVRAQPGNPALYPFTVFDAEPPRIAVPSLKRLIDGATSDQDAVERVVAYYHSNRERLARAWGESNKTRLQALFAMYVIHISHPYGSEKPPATFVHFVQDTRLAFCGSYSIFQSRILDGFGLEWRYVAISSGEHGWIEVKIDNNWEIFDATVNVWIDQSAFSLVDGRPRRFYLFYSPWSDSDRPDARVAVAEKAGPIGGTPGLLRSNMLGFGIYYMRKQEMSGKGLAIQVWKDFRPPRS